MINDIIALLILAILILAMAFCYYNGIADALKW